MALKFITAEEAASYVHHNDNVGFSGFTPAGCPKVVPGAIARKAAEEHAKGNPFQIGMFTGASTGDKLDGELARANAIKFRTPYQSNKDLRAALNAHQAQYFDLHLSELAQSLRYGFLGKIDVAIVEAADVTEDGEIVPTSGVGILPTICRMADRIIVELNCRHPKEIRGMHDIYEPARAGCRTERMLSWNSRFPPSNFANSATRSCGIPPPRPRNSAPSPIRIFIGGMVTSFVSS